MAKILISMRDDFLGKIDELADVEQRSRSELIRQALRVYIRRRDAENPSRRTSSESIDSLLLD